MIYFKNANGEVFAYETQTEREAFGTVDLVAMTNEEIEAHKNPEPTSEQIQQQANIAARQYLASTDWIVRRHNDELDMGETTTLTNEEYIQLLIERKQKRLLVVEI